MDSMQELSDAVAALRQHNDKRLDEIAQNGAPRAETEAAITRANAAITAVQERVERAEAAAAEARAEARSLEDRLNRPEAGSLRRQDVSDERMVRYARFESAVKREEVDPAHVDLDYISRYQTAFYDSLKPGRLAPNSEGMGILNAALAGDNPSGGFYVEPDMNGRIIEFLRETSPVRQVANVQVTSGDRLTGKVQLGEAGSGWVGETETRPATDSPTLAEWEIPLREQYAMPEATQRIIDLASVDIAAWMETAVRRKLARDEATAFVTGNTPKRPRGFTTYDAGTPGATAATWPVIEQVASLAAATLTADGLHALVGSLFEEYLSNARFGMRRATELVVRQMKDGNGNYLWQPDFAAPAKGFLLGYPVVLMADMPAIGAGDEPIVFADFAEAYQIVDSPVGLRVLVDPYTNKPYVRFYTTRYVGGDVVNFQAIKLQTCSAS